MRGSSTTVIATNDPTIAVTRNQLLVYTKFDLNRNNLFRMRIAAIGVGVERLFTHGKVLIKSNDLVRFRSCCVSLACL